MSDIGILNDPVSIIEIILLLGSPGFLLGAILGAAASSRRRAAGRGNRVFPVPDGMAGVQGRDLRSHAIA